MLQPRGWRFCFIGGIALLRWEKPRETVDADVIIMTGFGNEQLALDLLLTHFEPRIGNAASFALENRVLLLRSRAGVGLDISLGAVAYEELAVRRASDFPFTEAITLKTCSAEDLIVMKAFAGPGAGLSRRRAGHPRSTSAPGLALHPRRARAACPNQG